MEDLYLETCILKILNVPQQFWLCSFIKMGHTGRCSEGKPCECNFTLWKRPAMCPHDLIYLRAPRLLLRLQLFSSHNRGPFKIFISDISLRSLFQAQPTHTVSLCFPPPLFVCRVQSVTQRVTTAGFCVCLPITEPPVTELAVALERCELHAQKKPSPASSSSPPPEAISFPSCSTWQDVALWEKRSVAQIKNSSNREKHHSLILFKLNMKQSGSAACKPKPDSVGRTIKMAHKDLV